MPVGIDELPDEMLLHILLLSALSGEDSEPDARWFPMCYAGVNRRWKALVLHSPVLWATIELIGQKFLEDERFNTVTAPLSLSPEREAAGLRRSAIHLERSKMTPLTLRIFSSIPHSAIEAMIQHHTRWKDVELVTTYEALVLTLMPTLGSPWNLGTLERLHLNISNGLMVPYRNSLPVNLYRYPPILDAFACTPRLQELAICGDVYFQRFKFSWVQLRSLTLKRMDIYLVDLHDTLSQCRSLTRLAIQSVNICLDEETSLDESHGDLVPLPVQPLTLNELRYLEMDCDSSERYLTQIIATCLEELVVLSARVAGYVATFLRSSGTHIKMLELEEFTRKTTANDNTAIHFDALFQYLPSLEWLSIHFDQYGGALCGPEAANALLAALTFNEQNAVCPKLMDLYFGGADLDDPNAFMNMLTSRTKQSESNSQHPEPLLTMGYTSFSKYATRSFNQEEIDYIRSLIGGMEMFVMYDGPNILPVGNDEEESSI